MSNTELRNEQQKLRKARKKTRLKKTKVFQFKHGESTHANKGGRVGLKRGTGLMTEGNVRYTKNGRRNVCSKSWSKNKKASKSWNAICKSME